MQRIVSICALVLLLPTLTTAQVVTEMIPERIDEAIKIGEEPRGWPTDVPGWYPIQIRVGFIAGPTIAFFSTPFSRVVEAAYNAKRRYQIFTRADVTTEMIAPVVRVLAPSVAQTTFDRNNKKSPEVASVEAVVIQPKRNKDRAAVIQPLSTLPAPAEYQNLFGAIYAGAGIIAEFPLSSLSETNEFRIVYDRFQHEMGCTDCPVAVRLKDVR